jgi:hypothetical protein
MTYPRAANFGLGLSARISIFAAEARRRES